MLAVCFLTVSVGIAVAAVVSSRTLERSHESTETSVEWTPNRAPAVSTDVVAGLGHPSAERALVMPRPRSSVVAPAGPAPGYDETSEFFAGRVGVSVLLVESAGSAYNWTDAEVTQTVDGIYAGLAWWATQEPKARLSFSYELHVREATTWEPIQNSIGSDYLWIDEILGSRGYSEPDAFQKALHFNNGLRTRLGTDWAYSIFVVDSEDAVNQGLFVGGGYAHAYFGGPWVTMSRYSSWAYNAGDYFRVVPAHETGHIFYATDEYDSGPPQYSGYLNCPDSNGATGIMNRNTLQVSPSTRCQIGWVDSDNDGTLDILGVPPETDLVPHTPNPTSEGRIEYSGSATVVPLVNQNPIGPSRDVTISRITRVEFLTPNGVWTSAEAVDGAYDGPSEAFAFRIDIPVASSVRALPAYVARPSFVVNADVSIVLGTYQVSARAVDTEAKEDPAPALDELGLLPRPVAEVELWYRRDAGAYALYGSDSSSPWTWTFTAPAEGDASYSFYSISIDSDGIREPIPSSSQAQTLVDTARPVLVIGSPRSDALIPSASVEINWTATDSGSGIDRLEMRVDGGAPQAVAGTGHRLDRLSDGPHTVTLAAYDRAGNVQYATVHFTVDTGIFSVTGPYGPYPLVVVFATAAVLVMAALGFWLRRRGRTRLPKA